MKGSASPWTLNGKALERAFETDGASGLDKSEAAARLAEFGPNELPDPPKKSTWELIMEQFDDPLVKILLIAAAVSLALAFFEEGKDAASAFVEPAVIMLILILNACVAVWQEGDSDKAIEALKEYEAPTAKVVRGGRIETIAAKTLVPGDVVEVAVGDSIPADLRLVTLRSTTIRMDQAALTGESASVFKYPEDTVKETSIELQGQINMAFNGTVVSYGKAVGIVTATGERTELGKISSSLSEQEEQKTPLGRRLDEFGDLLTKIIAVICILIWIININHFNDPVHGGSWTKGCVYYFKIAVALAVAAIPEGLPAVVTTCLALGTRRMAKKNAIVRFLPSVETLGCTSIICSDKTGTLTTNQMSVSKVLTCGATARAALNEYDVEGTTYEPAGSITEYVGGQPLGAQPCEEDAQLAEIARISALCNSSSIEYRASKDTYSCIGEPTEAALCVLTEKIGLADAAEHARASRASKQTDPMAVCDVYAAQCSKVATLEFSRDRKSMSVLVKSGSGRKASHELLVKGAPELVLDRCTHVALGSGKKVKLTKTVRANVDKVLHRWGTGQDTLRCLALARVDDTDLDEDSDLTNPSEFVEYEQDMTFVGLVGMLDPPRLEVFDSIQMCRQAGVRVIVITGDNKDTAEAICRRIGVFAEGEDCQGKSFTGREFDGLSLSEKNEAVRHASLFSRTEPSHKMALVELLQKQGECVAMTGDGVNDAPALKRADIGIGMGSGTAVARGASDMVLADDNFSTIVAAVEEGRAIFNNTKAFIRYMISSNIGEVFSIFFQTALGMPEALIPVQLLWVNLVTDGLPATALSFNPPDADVMRKPPRSSREPLITNWVLFRYLLIGLYVGVATCLGFAWWFMWYEEGPQMTFGDLTSFSKCVDNDEWNQKQWWGNFGGCEVFKRAEGPTMALSVLVTIEMLNTLNAVSENLSILQMPPWVNPYLIIAICFSQLQHLGIMYFEFTQDIFSIAWLNWVEWKAVLAISFPVILIDRKSVV